MVTRSKITRKRPGIDRVYKVKRPVDGRGKPGLETRWGSVSPAGGRLRRFLEFGWGQAGVLFKGGVENRLGVEARFIKNVENRPFAAIRVRQESLAFPDAVRIDEIEKAHSEMGI